MRSHAITYCHAFGFLVHRDCAAGSVYDHHLVLFTKHIFYDHRSASTHGQDAPKKIKRANKTLMATAISRYLKSESCFAVP